MKIPLSPTTIRSGGIFGASCSVSLEVYLERFEIAIVDADQTAVEREGALELGVIVNLGDGVHVPILRRCSEVAGGRVIDLRPG